MRRNTLVTTLALLCATLFIFTILVTLFPRPTDAQTSLYSRPKSRAFAALSSVTQTPSFALQGVLGDHTAAVFTTGSPTGCTLQLQGSRDGTNWFSLGSAVTCTTSGTAVAVGNAPAQYVRGNLTALSGGSSPTATLHYIGR